VRVLLLAGLRFHLRRRAQLALTVAGVALGVAVVAAMHLAIESARRGFELSNEAVFGHVSHSVEGGPAGLEAALHARLRLAVPEIPAAPVVSGRVVPEGGTRAVTLLGVDPFAESAFRRRSPTQGGSAALAALLTRPGGVLASAGTAARLGVTPGRPFGVRAGGRAVTLVLLDVVEPRDALDAAGLDDVLVADIATAQEVLGRLGRLSRIDLALPVPEAGGAVLLERVRDLLPAGVRLREGAARAQVRREMTRAFYLNLRMLSLLALLVGLFIIYNAMTFAVVQRRALIGTLRAVGLTRREVLVAVLGEAGALGAVATVLGLPAGIALARHLLALITRTVDDLYFATAVRDFALVPEALVWPAALGIVGSVAAALVPALEATRIPPRAALTASHLEARARGAMPRLAGLGMCTALASLLCLAGGERSLQGAFAALFLLVATATLWTPVATVGASRALERLAGVPGGAAGALGAMAVRGLRTGLSRNAVAVAALMVALATTVGVAVMVASFRLSLQHWLDTTLAADVYVAVPGRDAGAALPPRLAGAARRLPGVHAVSLSRDVEVSTSFGDVWLKAVSVDGPRYRGLQVVDGDAARAWAALVAEAAVLVSEPFAWRHRLSPGMPLTLHTARGPRPFRVAGVFRDYGSERGMLLMGLPAYRAHFRDAGITGLGLTLAPDVEAALITERLRALAGPGQALQIRDQAWIRDASMRIFDRTFAITRVLQWLATGVACIGVLGALMALALERAREMAVLRAQGLTARELLAMLTVQTACMGLVAGVLSLPLGTLLSLVLVHVVNRRAFGWGMEFHLPPEVLVHTLLVALAAALLAGLYPAWRMASTPPAVAVRGV
jgi:putative ABC transport system permease protein